MTAARAAAGGRRDRADLADQTIAAGGATVRWRAVLGAWGSRLGPASRRLRTGRAKARIRRKEDRGAVAVLMCFIVVIGGLLVTFLVDAGAQLQAANRADIYSAEAARSASIAIGPVPAEGGGALRAAAAARSYLAQAGVSEFTVSVTGPATVAVRVTVSEDTPILGMSVAQTRTHTAQLQVGVSTGQALP